MPHESITRANMKRQAEADMLALLRKVIGNWTSEPEVVLAAAFAAWERENPK